MRSFKVLSALLAYPDAEVIAHREELRAILATEGAVPPAERAGIGRLIDELGAGDLLDAQERYVGLFDRTRSLSLQLFEHVHGDSRDRGQAMVDLAALYRRHGMEIAAQELPDHLPLFLEFLAELPPTEAKTTLADTTHILGLLHARLRKRGSSYAGVFAALLRLAGVVPAAGADETDAADDDSPEAMDRAWEEVPVTFGGPDALASAQGEGCSRAAAILSRMQTN